MVVERYATVRRFVKMLCRVIEFEATADAQKVLTAMRDLPGLLDARPTGRVPKDYLDARRVLGYTLMAGSRKPGALRYRAPALRRNVKRPATASAGYLCAGSRPFTRPLADATQRFDRLSYFADDHGEEPDDPLCVLQPRTRRTCLHRFSFRLPGSPRVTGRSGRGTDHAGTRLQEPTEACSLTVHCGL